MDNSDTRKDGRHLFYLFIIFMLLFALFVLTTLSITVLKKLGTVQNDPFLIVLIS